MSINVNVSANPILIKNGKMVNGYDKGEFDRRRLMRLQQVRQQSKAIAEKLRKKVQNTNKIIPTTATTQQSDLEQKSEEQLQCWQAKRLLELQNQYQDALSDIGLGHRQVDSVTLEEDKFNRQQQINEIIAEERGRNALDKVQVEKNEQNIKQATPVQRKKIVRDMENERAANLQKVQQNKSGKTKQKKTPCKGTVQDKNKENRTVKGLNFQEHEKCSCWETRQVESKESQTSPKVSEDDSNDKFVQTSAIIETSEEQEFCKDTRISDRMKQRQLPDSVRDYAEIYKSAKFDDDIDIETVKSSIKPKIECCHHCKCKNDEIPIKSKIKLKSAQQIDVSPTKRLSNKSPTIVHRIGADDISESVLSDDHREFDETLKQQQNEKQAKLRGKKALERDRINRDYQQLLNALPVLQKQENLLDLNKKNNVKIHMSEERLKEQERRKQNQMDNAYEKLFANEPKTTIVTLPKKQDLPNWDTDTNQPITNTNLQDELKRLLKNLQQQKDELLRENNEEIKADDKKRKRTVTSPNSSDNDVNVENKTTQTQLARKKIKTRQKNDRGILIRQNSSTQTSPKIETDKATSPIIMKGTDYTQKKQFTSTHVQCNCDIPNPPCTCNHVPCNCNIPIIRRPVEPYEIIIKVQQDYQPLVVPCSAPPIDTRKFKGNRNLLWREQLNRNMSSGTSYLSLPDKSSSIKSSDGGGSDKKRKNVFKYSKRFEARIDGTLDPRLLKYIRKLLNASRQNVDDLSTTSPSDSSTPSGSTIEIPSNNPTTQLTNVMKYFNLTAAEIKDALDSNASHSIHYNTSESSVEIKPQIENIRQEPNKDKYTEIVDACSQKISDLSNMIDKVRAEKIKILQEAPQQPQEPLQPQQVEEPVKCPCPGDPLNNISISNSILDSVCGYLRHSVHDSEDNPEHEEALRKLLHIDMSFARELKKCPPGKLPKPSKQDRLITDEELLARYKRLFEFPPPRQNENQKESETMTIPAVLKSPTLSKLESFGLNVDKSKPPPSTALFRGSQDLGLPHELSTILEADSQHSTTLNRADFFKTIDLGIPSDNSDRSEIEEAMEEMLTSIGMAWAIPTLRKTREALALASTSASSTSSSSLSKSKRQESLKNFLMKQLIQASSSTNESTDNQQATSTPILGNQTDGNIFFGSTSTSSKEELNNCCKPKRHTR